jgi:spore germination protein
MQIYVVQPGDTLQMIAERYGISAEKLASDNGLDPLSTMVIGQSIVIASPEQIYIVKEGDTLTSIARDYNISVMQLLMNNPDLSSREELRTGEEIIISYNRLGYITTHGNTVAYINIDNLRKTLPYLTYLSILNYTATAEGDIFTFYDDTEIIQLARQYQVIPLLLLTTLTIQGEANIVIAYDILLNDDFQNRQIENLLTILRTKGYSGVNLSFEYVNSSSIELYEKYLLNIANRLIQEGYLVFVTVNPNINQPNGIRYATLDYSLLDQAAQSIIFMTYEWAKNINPPGPISSAQEIDRFLAYISQTISTDKVIIGIATLGYDWELPFYKDISDVYPLSYDRVIDLAREVDAAIQFDAVSQTPFFYYSIATSTNQVSHSVWFIDARSINAKLELGKKYDILGISVWNITLYNPQLWLLVNSQYEIIKYPESN